MMPLLRRHEIFYTSNHRKWSIQAQMIGNTENNKHPKSTSQLYFARSCNNWQHAFQQEPGAELRALNSKRSKSFIISSLGLSRDELTRHRVSCETLNDCAFTTRCTKYRMYMDMKLTTSWLFQFPLLNVLLTKSVWHNFVCILISCFFLSQGSYTLNVSRYNYSMVDRLEV